MNYSEARRHNATLRASSLFEPLRPLLRPITAPLQSPSHSGNLTAPPTPSSIDLQSSTPLSSSTVDDFVPLTPSPLFPRDVATLLKFRPDQARTLVEDYGLLEDIPEENGENDNTRVEGGRKIMTDAESSSSDESSGTRRVSDENVNRERHLSRFMAHIGVSTQYTVSNLTC
jgi:hypothetical protein